MMIFFRTRLAAAVLALFLLGGADSAQAAAYGYSYINVFGLTISNPSGSISLVNNIDLSRTTASLNGSNVIRGGNNEIDAPQATRGDVRKGQNDFSRQGMGPASYARGDAQILSSQIPPFPPGSTSTHTVNVAETFLAGAGSADASGRNGSTTAMAIHVVVGEPGATLAFNFQAFPYMQLYLDALAGVGSSASANMALTISLIDEHGQLVFNWAPDGSLGSGILGGTELADSANLNTGYAQSPLTSGSLFTYDPAGCGAPAGTGTGTDCGGQFSAVTNNLLEGNYTLVLNMVNSAELAYMPSDTPVPAPGTLPLLAAGLAMLAGLGQRRRRQAWRSGGALTPARPQPAPRSDP